MSFAGNLSHCDHDTYVVPEVKSGMAKPNVVATPFARQFKTRILSLYEPIVNFSGSYHVVSWGCGTQCHQFAIVDTLTGKVFEVPEQSMGYDSYRANSRLFVIHYPTEVDKSLPFSEIPKYGFYLWDEKKEQFKRLNNCDEK
jgi:hypothetical protein